MISALAAVTLAETAPPTCAEPLGHPAVTATASPPPPRTQERPTVQPRPYQAPTEPKAKGPKPSAETTPPSKAASSTVADAKRVVAAPVDGDREPTQGVLQVTLGDQVFEMPLVHTDVVAEIAGFVADVEVTQIFSNPFDEPVEAQYLFPLPDDAAVDAMEFTVGDRTIIGEIRERAEARAIYESARNAGKTASLLDQQRPNVFHQSVANILPGDAVEVTIHFVETLDYDDGGYEWVYPMVVGPRFIPPQGTRRDNPTEDAQRLESPYSTRRTGNDIQVEVAVDAGVPIWDIRSPSHAIEMDRPDKRSAAIRLKDNDRIPNKDFVLRYEVAGRQPEAALLTHRADEQGYFLLMIQPQAERHLKAETVTPKEMVFVVDTSCSMSGFPLAKAKDVMSLAISEMNPQDRFMILDFNDSVSALSPMPLPNSATNRRRGEAFVRSFQGSGGTHMLHGVQAALDLPQDPALLRTVLFLTDGYIGNESQILSAIEQRLGRSRLFSLGIGSSTNRFLLDRMAKVGRGHAQYLRPDEASDEAIERFYDRIRDPVLTDIEIEWDGVDVVGVYPDPIPDLFAGQPVVLVGRYDAPGEGTIRLTGRVRGKTHVQEIPVFFPESQEENSALASLWARTAIEDLEARQYSGNKESIRHEITELALQHDLVSAYTSFVAVEERVVNEQGSLRTVRVPLDGPEFVDLAATLGRPHASMLPHSRRGAGHGASGYGRGRGYLGKRSTRSAHEGGMIGAFRRGGGGGASSRAPTPAAKAEPPSKALRDRLQGLFETADAEIDTVQEGRSRVGPPPSTASNPFLADGRQPEAGSQDGSLQNTRYRTVSARNGAGFVTIELGRAVARSGLDNEELLDALDDLLSDVVDAWGRHAQASSTVTGGSWVLRLQLDDSGRVRGLEVLSDTLGESSLRSLLEGDAVHWQIALEGQDSSRAIEFKVRFSR
ncbi:MAG TPA: hypothetical protein DIU15_17225 [Deltaproteobacteria bacterium]|nr:hypothetical protein [Deltaproteobacteria bacterium]